VKSRFFFPEALFWSRGKLLFSSIFFWRGPKIFLSPSFRHFQAFPLFGVKFADVLFFSSRVACLRSSPARVYSESFSPPLLSRRRPGPFSPFTFLFPPERVNGLLFNEVVGNGTFASPLCRDLALLLFTRQGCLHLLSPLPFLPRDAPFP